MAFKLGSLNLNAVAQVRGPFTLYSGVMLISAACEVSGDLCGQVGSLHCFLGLGTGGGWTGVWKRKSIT